MRIAVAGATGSLGPLLVDELKSAGHDPVALSRSTGVDVVTGVGLPEALTGVSAVIDASGTGSTVTNQAVEFFSRASRNLLDAEQAVGVGHHVAISIVGARKIGTGYYAGKTAQEVVLQTERNQPWTLLRTTQFFEFIDKILPMGHLGPVQVVPQMICQPVAAAEVAANLVRLATGHPAGTVSDLAGPVQMTMVDLVQQYFEASGVRRRIWEVPVPGAFGRGMRDGSILPGPGTHLGEVGVREWLEDRISGEKHIASGSH